MRRKVIAMFLVIVLVLGISGDKTVVQGAGTKIWGEYEYSVLENGTVSIDKYIGSRSEVRIPETIEGKKVTEIGKWAFSSNEYINKVQFSSGIVSVKTGAFEFCKNLHYVELNEGLKFIGNGSFSETGLYKVKIPSTVMEIQELAFFLNPDLKEVTLSNDVMYMAGGVFEWCMGLEYVYLGRDVKEIVESTFRHCDSFKGFITDKIPKYKSEYVVIPSQIQFFYPSAFAVCNHIKGVVFPNEDTFLCPELLKEGCAIYGKKGGTQEEFAKEYGFEFHPFIQTNKISLNTTKLNLELDGAKTSKLLVNHTPANATIQQVVWSSSNPKVATVDQSGNVTAVSSGTATITARTFDESNLKQECRVTVSKKLQNISISNNELYLNVTNKKQGYLKLNPIPKEARVENVNWKSSNTQVATVSSNGMVTAKGVGKAVITATVKGKTQTCIVYVAPKPVARMNARKVTKNQATLVWSKERGVSGYRIYQQDIKTKKYKKIKECSNKETSYVMKKLQDASIYQFRIQPFVLLDGKKIMGGVRDSKVYTLPNETKITSIKRVNGKKGIKVNWSKVKKASYYEIWISTKRNKGYKCVKKTSGTSYTIKKLSKKKAYFVKIRAVAKKDKKDIRGKYSKVRRG